MTSVTSACLCWTLLSVCVVVLASEEQKITAHPGQDVKLTCRVPTGKTMRMLKWSRADLGERYVLLFRDDQSDTDPSFKNRVELQMKGGDASLILKNVTAADDGDYHCRVFVGETRSWELINISTLSVDDPPGPGGSVGLIVGLSVAAVLLVAAVAFAIYRKYKQQGQDSY